MDIKPLDDDLSVGPQILPTDMPALAKQGYRAIICSRPDGETQDQPSFAEIEKAASAAGLECRYLPITMGNIGDSDVSDFADALQSMPGPTLGYCRTGTRAALLWSLSRLAKGADRSAVLEATAGAGYDLSETLRKFAER